MKTFLLITVLLISTSTAFGAVSATAIAQCNQAQAKLLLQLNGVGEEFILSRAQAMNRFAKVSEQSAIARCLYTSDSDQDKYIRMVGVKARKGALRAMSVPSLLHWNNMVKPHTIQPLVTTCTKACLPVVGAAVAKQNCESLLNSFDTIINSFPAPESSCDLTAGDVQN